MNPSARLARLLALVPWLQAHPGAPVADVAREFGVTDRQLRADLDLIFVCGLPGYGPGDLMEVEYVGDGVFLRNADTISKPLRLTADEALALIVALRTLAGVEGFEAADAVDRALAKLESAAGALAAPAERVAVAVDEDPGVLAAVQDALNRGRRLHLSYYVPARDEATDRDVDPVRLVMADGRWYLVGWCRRAEGVRTFRLDRMFGVTVLDAAAEVPAEAADAGIGEELFEPSPQDTLVTLELEPRARWVADYYPCEDVAELPGGGVRVRLRARDDRWVRRLALGLAGAGRVVEPPEVVAAVRADAAAALAAYDGPGGTTPE